MNAEAWEEAGLYDPADPGADERRALLEFLTQRGATLDQMVDAHRLGNLPAVAGDLLMWRDRTTMSVGEVADRCGLPVERVQRVLLAVGLPADLDSDLPGDLAVLLSAFEAGAGIMGEEAILAFARVLGAAATNIAEAAVALFYAELGPGSGREGSDEMARARVSEKAILSFRSVPDVLSRIVVAQFDRVSRRAAVTRGWAAPAGSEDDVTAGPSEVVALGFVDLVGSTAWAERLSLRDQSLALSRFESAAWTSAVTAGGRVVKMIGDEAFFVAPSVDAACRIGIEVCSMAADDPLLPPARGAVGHGAVTPREGDYFGPLVNLVSRLAKSAPPDTLVVTEEAAASLTADRWSLRMLDMPPLRGLERSVTAFAVADADSPST
jgi:adenylate cyclase